MSCLMMNGPVTERQRNDHNHDQAKHRQLVLQQPAPGVAPERSAADKLTALRASDVPFSQRPTQAPV